MKKLFLGLCGAMIMASVGVWAATTADQTLTLTKSEGTTSVSVLTPSPEGVAITGGSTTISTSTAGTITYQNGVLATKKITAGRTAWTRGGNPTTDWAVDVQFDLGSPVTIPSTGTVDAITGIAYGDSSTTDNLDYTITTTGTNIPPGSYVTTVTYTIVSA